MIFTRRFGALAARRDFNDHPDVIEAQRQATKPIETDAAPQQETIQLKDDAAA